MSETKHGKPDRKNRHKPGSKWRLNCTAPIKSHASNFAPSSEDHPGFEFDEIVADDWLHAERMDDTDWWIRLGDQTFWVKVSRNPKVPSTVVSRGPA